MSILKYILLGLLVASVTVATPLSSDDLDELEDELEEARELEEEQSQAERELAQSFSSPEQFQMSLEKHISALNKQKPRKVCSKGYKKVPMGHDNADKYIVKYKNGNSRKWKPKPTLLFEKLGATLVKEFEVKIKSGSSSQVSVTTASGEEFQIREICVLGFGVAKVDVNVDGKLVETVIPNLTTSTMAFANCHRFRKPVRVLKSMMLEYRSNMPTAYNQGFYAQACIKS